MENTNVGRSDQDAVLQRAGGATERSRLRSAPHLQQRVAQKTSQRPPLVCLYIKLGVRQIYLNRIQCFVSPKVKDYIN